CMMDDFVVPAQAWIFIFQRIEAMWTCCHYFPDLIAVQDLYIHHSLHLEQEFISCAFGRVTGTAFFYPKNSVFDSYVLQYLAYIFSDTLSSFVEGTCTAYPKQ